MSAIQGFSTIEGQTIMIVFAIDDQTMNTSFKEWMNKHSIGFNELQGAYVMDDGEQVIETSYVVNQNNYEVIKAHLWTEAQESVLILSTCDSHNRRKAKLVFNNTTTPDIGLGYLLPVSKKEALADDNWSYNIKQNQYYVCKELSA